MDKNDSPEKIRKYLKKTFGMTPKMATFCCEYVVDFNATAACRRAGYSARTANQKSNELMRHPKVAAAIEYLQGRQQRLCDIEVDDVVRQLVNIAFFDPRELFDDAGEPIHVSALSDKAAMAIQAVKVTTIGNSEVGRGTVMEYRMADKNSAADKLMKHLGGYLADNKQRGLAEVSTEELQQELQRQLAGAGIELNDLLGAKPRAH